MSDKDAPKADGPSPVGGRLASETVVMPEAYDAGQTVGGGNRRWIRALAYPVKDDEGRGKVEAGLPLSSVRLHRQRHGAGHRARVPAARLRAIQAGRRLDEAAAGRLGLCLSVVRHLVEAQGGSVHAFSAGAGQGAPFTVELPPPADALYARGRARLDVIIGDMGCLGWTATK